MKENPLESLDFLLQKDVSENLIPNIGKKQWEILHLSKDFQSHRLGMWSAFLTEDAVNIAKSRKGWDFKRGDGKPCFSQSWQENDEEPTTSYLRFGDDSGFRPLVLYRSFWGAFPKYVEVNEELRLYHDLAEDKDRNLLLAFDESGREIEVVRLAPDEVSMRLKYLREFQAGTGLYVVIYFDSMRYSEVPIGDIPKPSLQTSHEDELSQWEISISECDFTMRKCKTFSRLLGKVFIPPPPINKAGVWPYIKNDKEKFMSFIVGIDEDGNETEFSSNPDNLGNYFGANPDAPHYLTPIYFRREVLKKYFSEPERYKVADGRLSCLSLWSCQIDNDLENYVVVFLGDLGRDMPYDEQLHWRQYNISPEGGISKTNFQRSFLNKFTNPQSPDLIFQHQYRDFSKKWSAIFGWSLFLSLAPEDNYIKDIVRVPVTNSQAEFDEQIGYLAKLLVDSLNEKQLGKIIDETNRGVKGIEKLDLFLEKTNYPNKEAVIQLLKNIQALRSTGSAHRKGSKYRSLLARLGINLKQKRKFFRSILEETITKLSGLEDFSLPYK